MFPNGEKVRHLSLTVKLPLWLVVVGTLDLVGVGGGQDNCLDNICWGGDGALSKEMGEGTQLDISKVGPIWFPAH